MCMCVCVCVCVCKYAHHNISPLKMYLLRRKEDTSTVNKNKIPFCVFTPKAIISVIFNSFVSLPCSDTKSGHQKSLVDIRVTPESEYPLSDCGIHYQILFNNAPIKYTDTHWLGMWYFGTKLFHLQPQPPCLPTTFKNVVFLSPLSVHAALSAPFN